MISVYSQLIVDYQSTETHKGAGLTIIKRSQVNMIFKKVRIFSILTFNNMPAVKLFFYLENVFSIDVFT